MADKNEHFIAPMLKFEKEAELSFEDLVKYFLVNTRANNYHDIFPETVGELQNAML